MNQKLMQLWERAREVDVQARRVGEAHLGVVVTVQVVLPRFKFRGATMSGGVEEIEPLVVQASGYCDRPDLVRKGAIEQVLLDCIDVEEQTEREEDLLPVLGLLQSMEWT